MIYLTKNCSIEVHRATTSIANVIKFRHLVTGEEYSFGIVGSTSDYYYTIVLSGMDDWTDGQYSYVLSLGAEDLQCGLAQLGEFKDDVKEYEVNNTTYKTYNYDE